MQPFTSGLAIESQDTHVVFDGKTGVIVHVHHTVNLKGAEKPFALHESAERAREAAKHLGHDITKLETMRVETFDGGKPFRVDVKARRLVEIVMKPPAKKAAKSPRKIVKKKKR